MGASASSSSSTSHHQEEQEQESIASSTASLPVLRSAFSNLCQSSNHPNSIPLSSLHQLLSLTLNPSPNPNPNDTNLSPSNIPVLLSNLGLSLTSLLFPFPTPQTLENISYLDFLKGFNKCCSRMPASSSLSLLLTLYAESCKRSQIPCKLEFDGDEGKVGGVLKGEDVAMILLVCWILERSWRVSKVKGGDSVVGLPDLSHLVASTLDDNDGETVSAQKFQLWVMSCAPGIVNCLSWFVRERFQACAAGSSSRDSLLQAGDSSLNDDVENDFLLTCGRAWAISLTLRNNLCEELSWVSFPKLVNEAIDNILYRSSIHGKGLNRFWSNVEGYHGPILILISVSSVDTNQINSKMGRWVIGILTEQGFENRDTFYGNSGYLYAISPIFRVFAPSGKEKNFIYSHLHPTGRVYEARPKPVGLAFGGTLGSERIFIDEDFAKVTLRHHAVDKTYQHGCLIPNQGFLPTEVSVFEVEVWGFGGKSAKQQQDAYKKRETLFTEQRRKVDLKTFGNWEDSPEKMMMDMITDPNSVRREDR